MLKLKSAYPKKLCAWPSSSSFSSSIFQTKGTFLNLPTRPKLDSAAYACALNHLCINSLPGSQMAGNGIWECTLFNFISHRSAIVFLLTGLQLYFSTIVFSRLLYHSGVELPIVSSPTIRKCFFFSPSFSKKTLILSKPLSMLWFALILISTKRWGFSPNKQQFVHLCVSFSLWFALVPCMRLTRWSTRWLTWWWTWRLARCPSEPCSPALACPSALHHHPCTVGQRLGPTDVLHRL